MQFPTIDGYEILGVLGRGGMGVVYRAVQTKLKRTVALKILPSVVGGANPQAVARFRREATAAAKLHHTHIIPIHDFGESHHTWYYTMELVNGLPLNEVISRFAAESAPTLSPSRLAEFLAALTPGSEVTIPLDAPAEGALRADGSRGLPGTSSGRGRAYYQQVARWMADAADALAYAHGERIVHRDVKPSNFILSADGRIMVADFGLALVADENSMTMSGSLLGTLLYMSPEQAMGKRMGIDHRTDIWSLGAVMYELLTLRPAFAGPDQKEILSNIITRDPRRPHQVAPPVPRDLETICLKALEKDPRARYDTARAMADDLRRFINDLPITAKPPGPVGRTIKFVRRHRAGVAAAAALVALVLLALTATLLLSASFRRNREQRLTALIKQGIDDGEARKWDAAESAFNEALKVHPDHAPALFMLARMKKDQFNSLGAQASKHLLEEADGLCRRGLQIDPNNVGGLNTHGVILKKLERYGEAQAAYARAVELNADLFNAWDNLAVVCAHQGDLAKAVTHAQRATELAGTTDKYAAYCWRNLASLRLHSGEPGVSEAVEKAIAANDLDPDSWLVCALSKLRTGESKAALDDIKHADRLAKGEYGRVKRILALAHLRTGEFADAVRQADAAIRLGDMTCINELTKATAHAGLGDRDAARGALQTAIERWPPALINEHAVVVTSDRGVLWFDTATELMSFRAEASAAIDSGPDANP